MAKLFSRLLGKGGEAQDDGVVLSPVTGEIIPIEEVADATFAQKILGDGLAVLPSEGRLYAPAAGKIEGLQDTGHALCLTTASGVQLLVHIGRDTVKMNGQGFKVLVKENQMVSAGEALIEFDLDAIKAAGYDTVTPLVILNWEEYDIEKAARGSVAHGAPLLKLTKKG